MIPEDLHYSDDHEWVRETTPGTVRIGITDYAQEQLGDVIQVQLPQIGTKLAAGAAYGEVESTKSVSELVAPISEEVLAVNDDLVDQPELVNAEPYGNGWRLEARLEGPLDQALAHLHDAASYRSRVQTGIVVS